MFREIVDYRSDINHWKSIFEARNAALHLLDGLEAQADTADTVLFGSRRIKFEHARTIGVQAYLTTTWALADRIAGLVGQVFCTPDAGFNAVSPPQLISHFINRERTKKTTAATLYESLRQTFGWPIGLSYAMRNHFVHDGAQIRSFHFFAGASRLDAFRISNEGWDRIEGQAKSYNVDPSYHRAGTLWPVDPKADLRLLLKACEREMDDGLGVLLGSACNTLHSHVGFILGED
jgi:hypothetical protein